MRSTRPDPTAINVHIERLVLEGVSPHDRQAMAAALQAELASLIASQGPPSLIGASAAVPRIDAGLVTAAPAMPGGLGASVAQAIFRGMQG